MKANSVISFFKGLHINAKFFWSSGICLLIMALGFLIPYAHFVGLLGLILILAITLGEYMLLYAIDAPISATRRMSKLLNLGDENTIKIDLTNHTHRKYRLQIYDELPVQLQQRNFEMQLDLEGHESETLQYQIRPLIRGEFKFGNINILLTSEIGFASRRMIVQSAHNAPVFPSIQQMREMELMAFARVANFEGIKKVRRLGHSYEFEQIRNYVQGDDMRSVNWKATSRRNVVMVNQYEDERAQQVYSIIDKSRSMKMPFNGLSLLDYAINTALVISNIALKKHDKAGLITYSSKVGSTIRAEKSRHHLKKILRALYNEKEHTLEANYDLLYRAVKNVIKSRSLIFLYLNFESAYALERALPILRKINQHHLLVVMVFQNTELIEYSGSKVEYISDIYAQTIARSMVQEKRSIVNLLKKHGIQTILTKPEDLSMNTVNKYLELKSKGLI